MESESLKYDDGKLRMDLIPPSALRSIATVLTYGAKKYKANSWQGIAPDRYVAALLRHFTAFMENPMSVDEESGLLHIEHVICNAVFLNYLTGCKERGNDKWIF